jgi:hypothetical protein
MGTAFNPAKTSPASWDAFSDVDAFVDAVLAELRAPDQGSGTILFLLCHKFFTGDRGVAPLKCCC